MSFPGCDLPLVHTICHVVGSAGSAIASGVFADVAKALADGFGTIVKITLTFWTNLNLPDLSNNSGPIAALRADLWWVTGAIAIVSTLLAAGKIALTRNSRSAVQAAQGLMTLVVVSGVLTPLLMLLSKFGDDFSSWILNRAGNGALGARLGTLVAAMGPLGAGLMFMVAFFGIVASLVQIGLFLIRVGAIVMLTAVAPTFAATATTERGKHALDKLLTWLLAFVIYKPAAAIVYASAFYLVGSGKDAVSVLSGILLMVLAVLVLPALLRLLAPMIAHTTHGVGAVSKVRDHAQTVASGAKAVSARSGGGAAGASGGDGGKQSQPTGASASGAGRGGAGAGASGAAGAAGAASQVLDKSKAAAGAAVTNATPGGPE